MTDETLTAIREFLESFEAVFGTDWRYTKSMLGIRDEPLEQATTLSELGLEAIPTVAADATFLAPGVAEEIGDWGHRGMLLERYRRRKSLIESPNITSRQ